MTVGEVANLLRCHRLNLSLASAGLDSTAQWRRSWPGTVSEVSHVQGIRFLIEERWTQHERVNALLREQTRSADLRLAPVPPIYKRRYLIGEKLTATGVEVDFDAMTELVFPDRAAFHEWMAELAKPGVRARILADEEKFLNRARTRERMSSMSVTRE